MKKQDVSLKLINKALSTRKILCKRNVISFLSLFIALFLSINIQAQQTALLDANGVPISNEILLLLSTGSTKIIPQKTSETTAPDKTAEKSQTSVQKSTKKPKRSSNTLLEEELLNAMKAGQIKRVEQLLRGGISPTYINYKGETPLGIAVSRGWASMVITLLENGANINEKGAKGVTLLHVASAKGLIDVAKVLVKAGLNPSQKTEKNWTPLHIAARYNHWELVQYFVGFGVDPDIRNSDGKTALGLARHLRHQSIIKILSRVTSSNSLDLTELKLAKMMSKKVRKKSKN